MLHLFYKLKNLRSETTCPRSSNQWMGAGVACELGPNWLHSCPARHAVIWQFNLHRAPMSTAFSTVLSRCQYQSVFVEYIWRNTLKTYDRNGSNLLMCILLESSFLQQWPYSFLHSFIQLIILVSRPTMFKAHKQKLLRFKDPWAIDPVPT